MPHTEQRSPVGPKAVDESSLGCGLIDVRNDAWSPDVAELASEFEEERPARRLRGRPALLVSGVCAVLGVLALVQVVRPLQQGSQYYLIVVLSIALPLVFLAYRPQLPQRIPLPVNWRAHLDGEAPSALDWGLAVLSLAVAAYPLLPVSLGGQGGGGYDAFLDRQGALVPVDVVAGGVLLLLVLEACRRTTGWILPAICVVFLAYAYYGGFLPQGWDIAHRGMDFSQIVNALFNDASGFYGTPLDVAATYIVLFTVYGAVLDHSGAGRFFVNLSLGAFGRSRNAPGRTVTMTGFLLGTVSGSGAATAVSLGAVTWPILRRAGYPREAAGGMLAAAGIGAILSPPTLGAAAFIIAEYLQVSYLKVLLWAVLPSLLYYLGIVLAVEIDARRFGTRAVDVDVPAPWRTLARYGYHLSSLAVMIGALVAGLSAPRAVLLAIGAAVVLSVLHLPDAMTPRRCLAALVQGARGVLPVIAVCAAAGIITATITKTGVGLQLASLMVGTAESLASSPSTVLALTAVMSAVAVSVLGLAVPVTASFIISWVIIGPALVALGVSAPEAAMFIFYYAVLSEVTPPTALAAVAAAAVTGGDVVATMWRTWRYALPAFLVPLAIVLTPAGGNLLMTGSPGDVLVAAAVSAVAVAALAAATGGWLVRRATWWERALCASAALLLLYIEPLAVALGLALLAAAAGLHLVRLRARPAD